MKLRIDLERFDGDKGHVQYSTFKVGSKSDKYVLTVGGFEGSLGMSKYFINCIGNVSFFLHHLETKRYFLKKLSKTFFI